MSVPPDLAAFRPLADLLADPMLLVEADGTVAAVNRAFVSSFGWRENEIVGRELASLLTTPRERTASYLQQCAGTGHFLFGALTLRLPDGGDIACRAEGAAFRSSPAAGHRGRVVVRLVRKESALARFVELTQKIGDLSAEIARRQQAELAAAAALHDLQERELQLRELANSIPNMVWRARADGWVYWFNDQWHAYTGMSAAETEGWGWQSVHDPHVLPEVIRHWRHSIDTGTPFEMVFPLRGADGAFRRFLTRVNPVKDAQGRVLHWLGTNTDVETERRATEANAILRQREEAARQEAEHQKRLLYALFMQAPTLIAVLRGPNHVVELANPPMCQVLGRAESELQGRPLFETLPELPGHVLRKLLDEAYRTGLPFVGRETPATFDRGGGNSEAVYFDFVYAPFRNVQEQIEGTFIIASEVTDQVVARQQLDGLRGQAEAANRAKDEFLAMLGHELRNPLSPILTALQLMRLRGDETSERERTVIERQVNHLTRLVDDLLDVSRIARGKVELKRSLVEMSDVVAEAVETASPLLEQRHHVLKLEVPPAGLAVEGDPTRLSQVVANLLTNAAKYTSAGGEITLHGDVEDGHVVLRVRDSGIGIAPEVLPRVFDLFVQERQAIDRAQGGLGLGLTIVRNLVERHGGSVSAHSDGPGRGSEFVVRLPKASPSQGGRQTPRVGHAADSMHRAERRGGPRLPLRILIVDDNQDSAELLGDALKAMGYETSVALDAPAALQVAEDFTPDIALLDIGLPVMDGYELAGRLRQLPGMAGLRLVALTGYGQESDRLKSAAAGFDRHLVKPVDLDILHAILAAELSRPGGRHLTAERDQTNRA